jgi:hypothetical protein
MQRGGGQFFKDFVGHEVVTSGFLRGRLWIIACTSDRLSRLTGGSSWKGISRSDVRVASGMEVGSDG